MKPTTPPKNFPRLRGFSEHGVVFMLDNDTQAIADCPFCGKAGKLYVHKQDRVWDCKRCGVGGNYEKFLQLRYAAYSLSALAERVLAQDRDIKAQTLRAWGVGYSEGMYVIPVYRGEHVVDIRRYWVGKRGGRATSGSRAGLMRPQKVRNTRIVWLCEGEWDGMALSEHVRDDVYAVAGAGNLPQNLVAGIFSSKEVRIVFDNDDAGRKGATRAGRILEGIAASVKYIHWGKQKDGYDIRDLCAEVTDPVAKIKLTDKPLEAADDPKAEPTPSGAMPSGEGMNIEDAVEAFRAAGMHLPNPEVLYVMYGAIFANRIDGEPLWVFLTGPPGCGKSEPLMSLFEAPLIMPISTITSHTLISGANMVGGGDPSLIPRLDGKVMVTKDFTPTLDMNVTARDEIFSILRDAYDGEISKEFGNGIRRKYKSKFGILAGVTHKIEQYHAMASALGERFIKYKLKDPGQVDVGGDKVMAAIMNVGKETKMKEALRAASTAVLNREIDVVNLPKITKAQYLKFKGLAQWVSKMRGVVVREKYTREILFKPQSEIGTRLGKQFVKMAMGIAILKREMVITPATYATIVHIAQDTAPDRVEEVVKQMYLRQKDKFATTTEIAKWTRFPAGTVRTVLEDLTLLHIVKHEDKDWKLGGGILKMMKPLGLFKHEKTWMEGRDDNNN